jgi:hypothetical protein
LQRALSQTGRNVFHAARAFSGTNSDELIDLQKRRTGIGALSAMKEPAFSYRDLQIIFQSNIGHPRISPMAIWLAT